MCVIFAVPDRDVHVPADMLRKGDAANPHGAGLAWIDRGKVRFVKGLKDADSVMALLERKRIRAPYIVHFRIPTVGHGVDYLTHPFPLDGGVGMAGTAKAVLFHNGHWSKWQESLLRVALSTSGGMLPDGEWSDSRAMAWIAGRCGINVLSLIDEKVAVLTPQGIHFFGTGWSNHDGVWASNAHWKFERQSSYYTSAPYSTMPASRMSKAERRAARQQATPVATQPVCQCGHLQSTHSDGDVSICLHPECRCGQYTARPPLLTAPTPTPAPASECTCGHMASSHFADGVNGCRISNCPCMKFRAKDAPVAPAAGEAGSGQRELLLVPDRAAAADAVAKAQADLKAQVKPLIDDSKQVVVTLDANKDVQADVTDDPSWLPTVRPDQRIVWSTDEECLLDCMGGVAPRDGDRCGKCGRLTNHMWACPGVRSQMLVD